MRDEEGGMKKEVLPMTEHEQFTHTAAPVFDQFSRILILGTFPSAKSREHQFFYSHPQNRFWRVLAAILNSQLPVTVEEKKQMLLSHQIALWDVILQCEVKGSSDSSIKNVIPTDLSEILNACNMKAIFLNGKTAEKLFYRFNKELIDIPAITLPSTSPANAMYSLERLIDEWSVIVR